MSTRTVRFFVAFSLCFTGYDLYTLGRYGTSATWALVSLGFGGVALTCGLISLRMRARKDVQR